MTGRLLHVEADDDTLVEGIGVLERMGIRVECPALETRLRRRQRDDLLRRAHGMMAASSPWGRCVLLAAEILRFEGTIWPRLADQETLPEKYTTLTAHLFAARKLGELPQSARQLRNIIAKCGGPCDFGGEGISSAAGPQRANPT